MPTTYIVFYIVFVLFTIACHFWDKRRNDTQATVICLVIATLCLVGAWRHYKVRNEEHHKESLTAVEEVPQKDPPEVRQAKIRARIIGTAIKTRTPFLFRYDDVQRIVHPHRIGRSNTGNILLRAWEVQRAGESVGQWRTYKLDKITGVIPLIGEQFDIAPDYKSPDSSIPTVFLEIPINNKRAAE